MPSERLYFTKSPVLDGFLEIVWNAYPHLRGKGSDTVLFLASTYAHDLMRRGEAIVTTIPAAETDSACEEDSDPLDDLDIL